jgi:LPS-assembly lipoprotein
MWWFRASLAAIGLALLAAACGFQPLYASRPADGGVLDDYAAIKVAVIADRTGQQLRNELVDLLTPRGAASKHDYLLEVELTEAIEELALASTGLATRANLRLDAAYRLKDFTSNAVLLSERSSATSSYDLLDSSPFSTVTAQNDARKRTALRLAQDIRARLGVFFAARRKSTTGGSG